MRWSRWKSFACEQVCVLMFSSSIQLRFFGPIHISKTEANRNTLDWHFVFISLEISASKPNGWRNLEEKKRRGQQKRRWTVHSESWTPNDEPTKTGKAFSFPPSVCMRMRAGRGRQEGGTCAHASSYKKCNCVPIQQWCSTLTVWLVYILGNC